MELYQCCPEILPSLESAFTSAPVLTHWVPDKPIIVETDASDYALGAILSIQTDSSKIHPVDKTGICVGTDMLKFRLLFSHYK